MDVVRAASGWSASPVTDQQSGRAINHQPAVVSAALLTTEVQNESTGGAPTAAAAVDNATTPVEVYESPSAPEASASQRADHQTGCDEERRGMSDRQYDAAHATASMASRIERTSAATIVGPGDACAASAATEPPWNESREDEIATSPAVTSAWPSSTAVEQPYRRRERDDNVPMDAASTVTIAGPSDACAVTSAAEPPWNEPRREDETRPVDQGGSRCGALDVRHCKGPSDEDRRVYAGDRRADTEQQMPVTEPVTKPLPGNFVLMNVMLSDVDGTREDIKNDPSQADEINDASEAAAATLKAAGGTADTRMFINESEFSVAAGDDVFTAAVVALPRGRENGRGKNRSTDHTPCQKPPGPRNRPRRRRGKRPDQRRPRPLRSDATTPVPGRPLDTKAAEINTKQSGSVMAYQLRAGFEAIAISAAADSAH